MDEGAARAEARRVIERRLSLERAAFFGLLAAFLVALFLDPYPSNEAVAALLVFACVVALVGAGYDGAREAVRDLDMIAGLLERDGAGARILKIPFMMRGHYEVWFEAPAAGGPTRFGLSFGNSILSGGKRSLYMLTMPVPRGGGDASAWAEPAEPLREAFMPRGGEQKSVELFLRRGRGVAPGWQVRLFVRPGRPLSAHDLHELRQRAWSLAEQVAREGPGAVRWGTREAFRPPDRVEAGGVGSVPLRER